MLRVALFKSLPDNKSRSVKRIIPSITVFFVYLAVLSFRESNGFLNRRAVTVWTHSIVDQQALGIKVSHARIHAYHPNPKPLVRK